MDMAEIRPEVGVWVGLGVDYLKINCIHVSLPLLLSPSLAGCRLEPSSNQVVQPVYTNSIDKWREKMPLRDQRIIYGECDMLKELGYSP